MANSQKSCCYQMPKIGLGTYRLTDCEDLICDAIKIGYRHIDCASIYCNQILVGKGIEKAKKNKLVTREDLFITSKLWNDDHKNVKEACKTSIEQLGVDYLDLYLIHWPLPKNCDGNKDKITHILETWRCLERLVANEVEFQKEQKVGKTKERDKDKPCVKNIGVSNFSIFHLTQLFKDVYQRKLSGDKYAIFPKYNQVECHPYLPQNALHAFCKENDITLVAYAPLGNKELIQDETIKEIAREINATPAQVLIAWLLKRGICAIPKTKSMDRAKENFEAFTSNIASRLTEKHLEKIGNLQNNHRFYDGSVFCSQYSDEDKKLFMMDLWQEGFKYLDDR